MTISTNTKVTWKIQINPNSPLPTADNRWTTKETFDFESEAIKEFQTPSKRFFQGCLYRLVRVEETVTETVIA